jgi:hypothetical protein
MLNGAPALSNIALKATVYVVKELQTKIHRAGCVSRSDTFQ